MITEHENIQRLNKYLVETELALVDEDADLADFIAMGACMFKLGVHLAMEYPKQITQLTMHDSVEIPIGVLNDAVEKLGLDQ